MELTLAIILGVMVFVLIMNKSNFLFINIGTVLVIAAISFGVGYGIAIFVLEILGPILRIIFIASLILLGIGFLLNILKGR